MRGSIVGEHAHAFSEMVRLTILLRHIFRRLKKMAIENGQMCEQRALPGDASKGSRIKFPKVLASYGSEGADVVRLVKKKERKKKKKKRSVSRSHWRVPKRPIKNL